MRNENYVLRAKLRGYIFEIVIIRLLDECGFSLITQPEPPKIRIERQFFVEFQGRGTWHQIDCPTNFQSFIPFIYPIRLLAECKFHTKAIQKELIREYIGILKDIQENYFVTDDENYAFSQKRFTEIGVFFSASGFSDEAERLAFAHNIKTISYENIALLDEIKDTIIEIEKNYLSIDCISQGNQSDFMRLFRNILIQDAEFITGNLRQFNNRFSTPDGFANIVTFLQNSIYRINSSFIANTSGGAFIHFVSHSQFPDELFNQTDSQRVRIHFETIGNRRSFYMIFTNDDSNRRFFFKPPVSLSLAAFLSPTNALDEKQRIFRTIHLSKIINGISRNLILQLDQDWLNENIERLTTPSV